MGKSLRLNLDGSIPEDNPKLAGVVSHVYTYGHRNMQGIDFGPDGTLYASEQGPKTDDEINILKAGSNYGWPHVAGMKDNKAYEYARWADATTPCSQLTFSDLAIDPSVPREPESAFQKPFVEPIATMFTVPTGYNFHDPVCKGVDFICWPTVGASSIEYYASKGKGIPGWDKVLLVTTLKRGSLYVLPLTADGKAAAGHFSRYFQSENRYRDTAVSPDGRTIYIATDSDGLAEALDRRLDRARCRIPARSLLSPMWARVRARPLSPDRDRATTCPAAGEAAPRRRRTAAAVHRRTGRGRQNRLERQLRGLPWQHHDERDVRAAARGRIFQEQMGRPDGSGVLRHARTMPPAAPASLPDGLI